MWVVQRNRQRPAVGNRLRRLRSRADLTSRAARISRGRSRPRRRRRPRADSRLSAAPDWSSRASSPGASIAARRFRSVVSGNLIRGTDECPFSLTGEGIQLDSVTFKINVQRHDLSRTDAGLEQPEPRAAFGAHRIHDCRHDHRWHVGRDPANIEASAGGMAVRSDDAGHYQLTGVAAGAVTVQFAAASYVTQTKTLTLSENSVLDVIRQRVAPPAPAPAPAPISSSGDQIDLHAGFQAARQRNPSGAISSDKVSIFINGAWRWSTTSRRSTRRRDSRPVARGAVAESGRQRRHLRLRAVATITYSL